jgi:lysophospholipase L1-like esterase
MNPENKKNYAILLLLYLFMILFVLSLLTGNVNFFGIKIKVFDPISDVKPDSLLSTKLFFPSVVSTRSGMAMILPFRFAPSDKLEGNIHQMSYFYNALKDSKTKNIRIAHFGDSVIEGDLITSDFRSSLQSKFGGDGIGMLSFTSEDTRFRVTVKHSFSDDWKTYTIFGGDHGNMSLGINGTVSIPSQGSWIKLESSGIPGTFKTLKKIVIYYSDAKNSSLKYSLNNSPEKSAALQTGSGIKQLIINGENSSSIKIISTQKEQARFYGISIESDKGIIVDNFPIRGNSGVSIRDINSKTMQDFNKYLDYKLIILQFGLNLITTGQTDLEWYEKEMVKVINQLKSSFPESSLLIVGIGDKCIKKGSRLITDPNILKLVALQKRVADETGIAFWNLFESMGGENSMLEWANSKPPLAMKDYTHFNNEGARRIAKMLSDAVLQKSN